MKSTLTGIGVFVLLVVVLFFGAITNWTFHPRENVAIGAGYLAAIAPFILGFAAFAAILSVWIARIKGW